LHDDNDGSVAKRNGFSIDGTKAVVVKHMTSQPVRRIRKLEVLVTVPLPPDHPQRAALEKVALNCPVQKSLSPELEIPVTFSWAMICEKAA
jgi:putative redox protein